VGEEIFTRLDYLDLLEEREGLISSVSLPNLEALADRLCLRIHSEPEIFRVLRIFKCTQYFGERICDAYPKHRCCHMPFEKFSLLLKTVAARMGDLDYYRGVRSHAKPLLEYMLRRLRKPAQIVLPMIDYSRFNVQFQLTLFRTFKLVIPRKVLFKWAICSLSNPEHLRVFRKLTKKIGKTLQRAERIEFVQRALIKLYVFRVDLDACGDWHIAGYFRQYMKVMLEHFPHIVLDQWDILYQTLNESSLALIEQVSVMRGQIVPAWAFLGDGLRVIGMFHRNLPYSMDAMNNLQLSRVGVVQVFDFLCALTAFHNHPDYARRQLLITGHLLPLFESPSNLFRVLQAYNTYRILDVILTTPECPFTSRLIGPLVTFRENCNPQFLATVLHRVIIGIPAKIKCIKCQVVVDVYQQSLRQPRIDPCQGENTVTWRIPAVLEEDMDNALIAVRSVLLFFLDIPLPETLVDETEEGWAYSEYSWMLGVLTDRYCQTRFGKVSQIKFETQPPSTGPDSSNSMDILANDLSVMSLRKNNPHV
jgi:hypothetical protein